MRGPSGQPLSSEGWVLSALGLLFAQVLAGGDEVGDLVAELGGIFVALVSHGAIQAALKLAHRVNREVAGGVADDAGEIAQNEEAEVALVVHGGFFAERLALFAVEVEAQVGAVAAAVVLKLALEVFQERFAVVGAEAIGPAGEFHLKQ